MKKVMLHPDIKSIWDSEHIEKAIINELELQKNSI